MAPQVLIVGAGPTGLVLALALARRGIPFRIISNASGPGEHSRAMGVHARTLEFYQQFGFADEVVARGVKMAGIHLRTGGHSGAGREVMQVSFADLGEGISPFPFMLTFAQDDHERFLLGELNELGVDVEWNTELVGVSQDRQAATASISDGRGAPESTSFDYVCGCDGARSRVRESLGVGFPGGSYEQLFFVADVEAEGDFDPDLYINLSENILALMMPVRTSRMHRLIGIVPPDFPVTGDPQFEQIRNQVEALLDIHVTRLNWFSTYHVHHRVAEHFRVGRAFLLGDAGHIHSPAGGQGMNTGIGDAINLGWKLAQVLHDRAPEELLSSYEPERIAFARRLVDTTDRAFRPLVAENVTGKLMRRIGVPLAVAIVSRVGMARRAAFRTVSQVRIHYDDSPLSVGKAGHVRGGDRLPWAGSGEGEGGNFGPLTSLDWQVHVYGTAADEIRRFCQEARLPLHILEFNAAAARTGLARDATYLVRPDGYVAFVGTGACAAELRAFVDQQQLSFAGGGGPSE